MSKTTGQIENNLAQIVLFKNLHVKTYWADFKTIPHKWSLGDPLPPFVHGCHGLEPVFAHVYIRKT